MTRQTHRQGAARALCSHALRRRFQFLQPPSCAAV